MFSPPPDPLSLHCLVQVLDSGSVSAAAAKLGLSQPSVTQRIAKLEDRVGTPLLDRAHRPLTATPAGRKLASAAENFLREEQALAAMLPRLANATADVLRIGMPDSMAEVLGAELLGALGSRAERVELRSGISPWLEQGFRDGAFDLAIDSPPYVGPPPASRVPLFADPLVLVCPSSAAGDLSTLPHVAYGRNSKLGRLCGDVAATLGATGASRFSFDSTQSLLRFVQAGYGWTVTTAFCLLQSPEAAAELDVSPVAGIPARRFELLLRAGVVEDPDALAASFRSIMLDLASGAWARRLGEVAALIRGGNSGN